MYTGTINLSNSSDLNILKEQNELIAAINGQLKEFSSLKSYISAVFEIIKLGGDKTKEVAAAGKELNAVSQLSTSLLSKLSESMALDTSTTKAATVAKQAFANISKISAGQITVLITAITAVVAAISTFVKWINRTNEAGEAAKTSAENLVAAQEELSQSAIDRSAAHVTGSFYK